MNTDPDTKPRHPWRKALKIGAVSLGAVIGLIALLLAGATWYLNPQRLTELVNREASENLRADVTAHNIRFTLWSTFPHLALNIDSIRVMSRALDSIPVQLRDSLPADARFLASTGALSGGINLFDLLKGKISLSDVSISGLTLNLLAVNDSIANYNIVPESGGPDRIPYFTANRATLIRPHTLRYRSLQDGADIAIPLHTLSLLRKQKSHDADTYALELEGRIDAIVSGLHILKGFPVNLDGDVRLAFNPFRIRTDNYAVTLGTLRGHMDMNLRVGESMSLDSFSYRLSNFNLARLLESIPGLGISPGAAFEADLTLSASARLIGPWEFSSSVLPSAEVDFQALEGPLSYTLGDGRVYSFSHSAATGSLYFNGRNPDDSYFEIHPFSVSAPGAEVTLEARADNLFGTPSVSGAVDADADLAEFMRHSPFQLADTGFSLGKSSLNANTTFSFSLPPLSQLSQATSDLISSLLLSGDVSIRNLSMTLPTQSVNMDVPSIDIAFDGDAASLSAPVHGRATLKATSMAMRDKASGSVIRGKGLTMEGDVGLSGGSLQPNLLHLASSLKKASLAMPDGLMADMGDIALDFKAVPGKQKAVADFSAPDVWYADSLSLSRIAHTPQFLQVSLSPQTKAFINSWLPVLDFKLGSARVSTPGFPIPAYVRNLDLTASLDDIRLRNLSASSGISALRMKGGVSDLRQFLLSSTPAPLRVALDLDIDTIQINQLARAYEQVHPYNPAEASGGIAQKESDTISMLIPRNLLMDVHASARETRYMDLHLFDLLSDIHVSNGNVRIPRLGVRADFGSAGMSMDYRSADIQNIGIHSDLSLDSLNIVGFFSHFHSLLEMMPQMANLRGSLSAQGVFNMMAFPNMYVNIPSFTGNLFLRGRGLTVHQSPFIRRITRHLLIRNEGDLDIANMDVHVAMHDNLLTLYPFNFEVEGYRLRMGGVNNFNGDLYYHLGVEKWPLRIPFGLNIEGHFSHPEIRFGGPHYKVRDAQRITSDIMETHRFNIIAMGRDFMRKFIHAAARHQ